MSLSERAYRQIKERIITLELRPGAPIREAQLMEELEVGRTPIREALKQLQAENLVITIPRRGVFVADIAVTDLQQIVEVRLEMEALCARLAAQRATAKQVAQLKEEVAQYRRQAPQTRDKLLTWDRHFHQLLAQATGNKFLQGEIELLYNLSVRIWYLALDRTRPEDTDVDAHIEIVAAIEAGDSHRAEQRMRRHIKHFHSTIKSHL